MSESWATQFVPKKAAATSSTAGANHSNVGRGAFQNNANANSANNDAAGNSLAAANAPKVPQ